MSILVENKHGWFLSSKIFFDKIYFYCENDNKRIETYKFREEFFQINTPFLMDSATTKMHQNSFNKKTKKRHLAKKQKNEKLKQNVPDSVLDIEKIINKGSDSILQEAFNFHHLNNLDVSSIEWFENNRKAQDATKCIQNIGLDQPFNICNEKNVATVITMKEKKYLIPPLSTAYLCDIKDIHNLKGSKFDLIVIDPPWENKSVRRKKKYLTLSYKSLEELPVEELCSPGCLIVFWVTNNQKQINFITEHLFKKWNICHYTIWHWLKVTQKGHLIHPIDWHHKKPYENILLAHIPYKEGSNLLNKKIKEPEPHKIIVSVPSSIHSHKPPLVDVLKPYIPEKPKCLELFARYLLPGWTSLGNEVIKLQNSKLFEQQTQNLSSEI